MLVRICDIVATVRHVELPAKCPGCGKKVVEVSEINLTDSFIDGKVLPPDGEELELDCIWDFESDLKARWEYGEMFIVTGYRCRRCKHLLVEGDFHEQDGD